MGFRSREGVSPVIAVILLVAITVVLVGILWAWSADIQSGTTTEGLAPHVGVRIQKVDRATPTTYLCTFVVVQKAKEPMHLKDVKLQINDETGVSIDSYAMTLDLTVGAPHNGVQYFNIDGSESPPELNEGDYIRIEDNGDGLGPRYTIVIIWKSFLLVRMSLPA